MMRRRGLLLLLLLLLLSFAVTASVSGTDEISRRTCPVRLMANMEMRYPTPNALNQSYRVYLRYSKSLAAEAVRACGELADSYSDWLEVQSHHENNMEEWVSSRRVAEEFLFSNPASCHKQLLRHACEFETARWGTPEAMVAFLSQIRPMRYIHIGAHVAQDFLHPIHRSCGMDGQNEGLLVEPTPSVFNKIKKRAGNAYENVAMCKTTSEVEFFTVGTSVDPDLLRDVQSGLPLPCYDSITQVLFLALARPGCWLSKPREHAVVTSSRCGTCRSAGLEHVTSARCGSFSRDVRQRGWSKRGEVCEAEPCADRATWTCNDRAFIDAGST
jgi:hypothetical protein